MNTEIAIKVLDGIGSAACLFVCFYIYVFTLFGIFAFRQEYLTHFDGTVQSVVDVKGGYELKLQNHQTANWILNTLNVHFQKGDTVRKPRRSFCYQLNGKQAVRRKDVMRFIFCLPSSAWFLGLCFIIPMEIIGLQTWRRSYLLRANHIFQQNRTESPPAPLIVQLWPLALDLLIAGAYLFVSHMMPVWLKGPWP